MLNHAAFVLNERPAERCRPQSPAAQNREGLEPRGAGFRAKVDGRYVSQLETGVYSASVTMLDKLSKALGVKASEFLKP